MRTWTVRKDAESEAWQRRIAAHQPLATRHRVLQLAMRYGLRTFAAHPHLLVEEAAACTDDRSSRPCTDSELTDRTDMAVPR